METIEIEGGSIEEAVERACDALNTTAENLEYQIMEQQNLGTGRDGTPRRKVKIFAKKREGGAEGGEVTSFAGKMRETLETILKMIDPSYGASVVEYPDRLVLNIKGDGSGLLIGKKGQTLDAIQHIVVKIAQKIKGDEEIKKIIVDTEKYREKRIDYLKGLAKKLAEKAVKTGRPVAVSPMSSYERRIIHMALEKEEGVYTESVGEGIDRKVMIMPKNERVQGNRRATDERYGDESH